MAGEYSRGESPLEVLYEIRDHAKGSISPPQTLQQGSGGAGGGRLLPYLYQLPVIKQIKDKWGRYKKSGAFRDKRMSLYVSQDGEHVAITVTNQVIILHKENDYMEPCGIFIGSDRATSFTCGAWCEPQGVLGVVDDLNTLYFIKSTGEEIARLTKDHLKSSHPVDLLVLEECNSSSSFLNRFRTFTADGLVYQIEATESLGAPSCHIPNLDDCLTCKVPLQHDISCLDFHPKLSLVVLVSASNPQLKTRDDTGLYSLYVLHMVNGMELEVKCCSSQLKGLFSYSKGLELSVPKVVISPQGRHVATLDVRGCVNIFNLDCEKYSLTPCAFAERQYKHMSDEVDEKKKCLDDIVDVNWWSGQILIVAERSGCVTMYDVHCGVKVLQNGPLFCAPILKRAGNVEGLVFVLDGASSSDEKVIPENVRNISMPSMELAIDAGNQIDTEQIRWKLSSLSQKSVSQMYSSLIIKQDYHAALNFADRYLLDKDDVLKAQWLHSDYGMRAISLFLSKVKDTRFVLGECVDKVGPTEEAVKSLLSHGLHITNKYRFSDSEVDGNSSAWEFRLIRLQLLLHRDRMETFVGINMGRFSSKEYENFRVISLAEAAITIAENGKIGALNLLLKRHPYSLSPHTLSILSAIPETIPVQSYGQLLPGSSAPGTPALREGDWVENKKMVSFLRRFENNSERMVQIGTENILKELTGFIWPSVNELTEWYKKRAKDIDQLSGQLDNCISLVEIACRKGLVELQHFLEDISFLHQLIYSDICDEDTSFTIVGWEQLSDFEKFRMMLRGVNKDSVVERLCTKAIPFMQSRLRSKHSESGLAQKEEFHINIEQRESYLVKWLKEIAAENKLEICLAVLESGCDDSVDGLFYNEAEKIETAVECLYLCTLTDRWNVMTTILSKLGQKPFKGKLAFAGKNMSPRQSPGTPKFSHQSSPFSSSVKRSKMEFHEVDSSVKHISDETGHLDEDVSDKLYKKIKVAEGHVEAGRLMEYYQVPKPMSFFLSANSEVKNVKQIVRLILSKFARRQPVKTDNDWTNMWRDLQYLQEKAFPFLDLEYILIEFCRGLLKAARFSLARYYLTSLPTEKAENLVIQAAREYFFSASSLHSNEIWKAKDCLSLFPNSKLIQAESDIIDALTIKLPSLGVTILPVQFRQVRNPMEIITMVISSQNGAYLNVEELIEIAKLLGLNSPVDIAAVEEAVAREAAVAGDLQLASNLCLVLAKKDHGPIWDLCAAIARGPHIDNMDMSSRKHLLGFALSHCDDESVGELLNAWKDADMLEQSEQLVTSTGANPPKFFFQGSPVQLPVYGPQETINLISGDIQNLPHLNVNDDQVLITNVANILSKVSMDLPQEGGGMWESLLKENKRALLFVAVEIPWLLSLSEKEEYGKATTSSKTFGSPSPLQMQAIVTILHWLAVNDLAPNDNLIANLAKVIMKSPVTEEDDIRGCSILLNLNDALHGVKIIEEQMKRREDYEEIYSIMNIGLIYGSLNNSCIECSNPEQRRKLLLDKFREKRASLSSDDKDQIDKVHSNFWRDWKAKLEKQKQRADEARAVENLMPGVESARFLSRDTEYIRKAIYSFIDTTKLEKKHILRKAVDLADKYGLHRLEMVLRFFACALVSEHWGNDDILAEISEFREDVVKHPRDVIYMVRSTVYPEIKGTNKKRLSYIYSILSACYLRLKKTKDPSLLTYQGSRHSHILQLDEYYKILEQECLRVSFIEELNFKNIAGLDDVNFSTFDTEVRSNIQESTVDSLAEMVRTFNRVYTDSMAKELPSWQAVYEYHVLSLLQALQDRSATSSSCSPDEMETYIQEVELKYNHSKRYFSYIREDILTILGRYLILCIPCCSPKVLEESSWKKYLFKVLDFWIKLADDINETEGAYVSKELLIARSFSKCLNALRRLLMEDEVFANQSWSIVCYYVGLGPKAILKSDILHFYKCMIFSGCGFKQISKLFAIAGHLGLCTPHGELNDIPNLYSYMMDDLMVDSRKYWNGKHGMQLLVSSLSRWEDDYAENLKTVRNKIWEKLQTLSNDIKLEGHVRVYALELMQGITGRNLGNLPSELALVVDRWEAWDESCFTNATASEDLLGGTDNLLSSLAALKSTQLVSEISPDIRITSYDLSTVDSAVSCFINLSNKVMSLSNLKILISVLEEWEKVFTRQESATEVKNKPSEEDYWIADDWDAGWENLPEEPAKKEDKYASRSLHPLHSCWSELIRRLIEFSDLTTILELLDRSFSNPNGLLLSEKEAQSLCQLLAGIDCILSLKVALLLPYEGPRSQSLHLLEAKLAKDGITSSLASNDYDILVAFLFSGVIGDMTSNSAFGKVFSYLCYLVGHTARLCKEDMLRRGRDGSQRKKLLIFGRILFPIFISELVSAKHYLLAALMVSKLMCMPASIHLIDVVEPCLRRFFQEQILRAPAVIADPEIDSYRSSLYSISYLKSKLMNMLQTALSALPVDTSN